MKSKIRVVYLSNTTPLNKKSWSGTHYQIYHALKNEFETVDIITVNSSFVKIFALFNKLLFPIFGKRYNYHHSKLKAYIESKIVHNKLKKKETDVIFCSAGSTTIAYLETSIPIFYLSDTSFEQFSDYYDVAENIFKFSKNESNQVEQKALDKATKIIYPTNWAGDFSSKFYNIKTSKIVQIHFGANIDEKYISYKEKIITKDSPFNILFLGVYWERKGGDIVLETYEQLISEGFNVHLTICGTTPPKEVLGVKVIPFLNKNKHEDLIQLKDILEDTNLLFIPSRAECYGIVFNEASAFGIPSLSTKTGGIPEVVIGGLNGFSLPLDATSSMYTESIKNLIQNEKLYYQLSIKARNKYLTENNWLHFGKSIRNLIESIS